MPRTRATTCFGRDRGFLVTKEFKKCQDKLLLLLGRNRGFLVATEFLSGSMSRQEIPLLQHGSHILSLRNCRNMAFLVATRVLVLCRDDVATEVSLSRREVRVGT